MTAPVDLRRKAGDLVVASAMPLSKSHLVTLTASRLDREIAACENPDRKERWRAKERAELEALDPAERERRAHLWNADSLCGVEPVKVTYGDRQAYYWTVQANAPDEESRCKKCFAKWRRAGKPTVVGWTDAVEPVDATLPFGWAEVAIVGHPHDVAPDGDESLVLNSAGEVVGVKRVELRRWQRGPRVVRIVAMHDEDHKDMHEVRYHHARKPLGEKHQITTSPTRALETARELIGLGGFP